MRPKLDIVEEFKGVVSALTHAKLEFAICGGFAVVIYGYVRATKDIDLLVEGARVEPVFAEVWAQRERIEWSGLTMNIVSKEGLATMKRLAGRKQDLADLDALGLPEKP